MTAVSIRQNTTNKAEELGGFTDFTWLDLIQLLDSAWELSQELLHGLRSAPSESLSETAVPGSAASIPRGHEDGLSGYCSHGPLHQARRQRPVQTQFPLLQSF